MEKDHHHHKPQETSLSLLSQNTNITPTNNDRLKRDEWSEGAVSTLLEAYELKWTLRNRAKLKGQDWEDVAKHVSGRAGGLRSAKTQTQCKNKIESMKKRYRSESAAADATSSSAWPLYRRLDLLLRGNGGGAIRPYAGAHPPPVVTVVSPPPQPTVAAEVAPAGLALGSGVGRGSNGGDWTAKKEGDGTNNNGAKLSTNGDESEKNPIDDDDDDTNSSTAPAIYTDQTKDTKFLEPLKRSKCKRKDRNKSISKRTREEYWDDEIGESIRWVAEAMVRSEQARMETMREIEKMRAEAEAKRGEIDLKRTEIIANTQLQIAKLFAKGSLQDRKTLN